MAIECLILDTRNRKVLQRDICYLSFCQDLPLVVSLPIERQQCRKCDESRAKEDLERHPKQAKIRNSIDA